MPPLSLWSRLQHRLRAWRRGFKARLPYVRRREYLKARTLSEQFIAELLAAPDLATSAHLTTLYQQAPRTREICLFVSYAANPVIKHHVREHIRAFHGVNFDVFLVLNTPHGAEAFTFDEDLKRLCRGIFVRENKGFDFGAWAHLAQVLDLSAHGVERIVLVNDSILGPLDTAAFGRMIDTIRRSPADMLGLTRSLANQPHLQSFFLAFQNAALSQGHFDKAMQSVRNFKTKEMVIDIYETHLTQHMASKGLRCESVFPLLSQDIHSSNDTHFRWSELIRHGFPYVKISLLAHKRTHAGLRAAIPAELLTAWEHENPVR